MVAAGSEEAALEVAVMALAEWVTEEAVAKARGMPVAAMEAVMAAEV